MPTVPCGRSRRSSRRRSRIRSRIRSSKDTSENAQNPSCGDTLPSCKDTQTSCDDTPPSHKNKAQSFHNLHIQLRAQEKKDKDAKAVASKAASEKRLLLSNYYLIDIINYKMSGDTINRIINGICNAEYNAAYKKEYNK